MRTLYGLTQSPWTERARWALDHHAVAYRYREHLPFLGELVLRRRAGTKKPSVPLLVDGDAIFRSSGEIARHADAIGTGSSLLAAAAENRQWEEVAEGMTNAARAWVLHNLVRSPEAQREALPAFVPGPLRPLFAGTSRVAIRFLASKHGVPEDVDAEMEKKLRPALERVRAALRGASSQGTYLADTFSWGDIAIATALHGLRPHARSPIGPATRKAWTNEALAGEFEDLLDWRDALYAKHR